MFNEVFKVRLKESTWKEGWIGFFTNDEDGHPEEFLSVSDTNKAQEIVNRLQKDIDNLTTKPSASKHNSSSKKDCYNMKCAENRNGECEEYFESKEKCEDRKRSPS